MSESTCHILAYHEVLKDPSLLSGFQSKSADIYEVSLDVFRDQLNTVSRLTNCAPLLLTTPEAVGWSLTFDDGGISNYDVILPELEDRGWKAHFFIVTSCIGSPGFMSAGQIRELHQLGHSVGSHSVTHPAGMRKLPPKKLQKEWQESKHQIEDILGNSITSAAVPYGSADDNALKIISSAGYRAIFTSDPVSIPKSVDHSTVWGRYTVTSKKTAHQVAKRAAGSPGTFAGERLYFHLKQALRKFTK